MDSDTTDQSEPPKKLIDPMMIGVVITGILLLGGYVLFTNKGAGSSTQTIPTQTPQDTQITVTTTPADSSAAGNVQEFTLTAKRFEFSPANITVKEGDTVKLTINSLDVPHGFAIDELGIKQDIEVGKPTTIEFIATQKGTFRFYCSLFCGSGHREMEGQLIVE